MYCGSRHKGRYAIGVLTRPNGSIDHPDEHPVLVDGDFKHFVPVAIKAIQGHTRGVNLEPWREYDSLYNYNDEMRPDMLFHSTVMKTKLGVEVYPSMMQRGILVGGGGYDTNYNTRKF